MEVSPDQSLTALATAAASGRGAGSSVVSVYSVPQLRQTALYSGFHESVPHFLVFAAAASGCVCGCGRSEFHFRGLFLFFVFFGETRFPATALCFSPDS